MKYTCKQCGKEFELEQAEIEFYESRNLDLPKRCKECRDANKQKRRQRAAEYRRKKQNKTAEYRRQKQEQTTERTYPTAQPKARGKRFEAEHQKGRTEAQRIEKPGTEHTKDMIMAQEMKETNYAANRSETEKTENEDSRTIRSIFKISLVFLAFLAVLCVLLTWSRSKKDTSPTTSARVYHSDVEDKAAAAVAAEHTSALHMLEAEDGGTKSAIDLEETVS